ncbi:membrane protein [Streptomyces spiroverticillatus]|uniref:Membrane protein n=1 Tax=Streptomyces finlayi TaxID=67296 RepID=A0A919CEN8_9ACTN|nr:membrane protein [Streptomyces spiroverticillatus]GHD16254.1 membrane protein [Streptomyces finlayi]
MRTDKAAKSIVLSRAHRVLIGVVVAGAVIIAGIGFAGSYAAVRELAVEKGFGTFALVFPIGIDAGICVLLALDLLLTWMRIPFPLLRQTAWLLTAATIAFNGAASWPDPLGVGMHAVIPVLFVVSVEAARHAVGRIADITADKHMDGVRLTRWLLSPLPTFRLWRRMKLWELRSYEQVIKVEQDRLIYQARLQARFGRSWKRRAPVESLMPLRLAKYGVPLSDTGPAGLAAAGIEPALLPSVPEAASEAGSTPASVLLAARTPRTAANDQGSIAEAAAGPRIRLEKDEPEAPGNPDLAALTAAPDVAARVPEQHSPLHLQPQSPEQGHPSPWFAAPAPVQQDQRTDQHAPARAEPVTVPPDSGSGRSRPLGGHGFEVGLDGAGNGPGADTGFVLDDDTYYAAFRECAIENGAFPTPLQFGAFLEALYGQVPPLAQLEVYTQQYQEQFRPELERAGAVADRTGVSNRVSVQMRLTAPHEEPEPAASPENLTLFASGEPSPSADSPSGGASGLSGVELVEFHYRALPPEEQRLSANALAPRLSELSRYAEGTTRKYLGVIKKADKERASGAS